MAVIAKQGTERTIKWYGTGVSSTYDCVELDLYNVCPGHVQ